MNQSANWKNSVVALTELVTLIGSRQDFTRLDLENRLKAIFGDSNYHKFDKRAVALIEFCFYKAGGPYSPNFDYYSSILSKIIFLYPSMRYMLNGTADAAIANMVLNARGKLKFEISDLYELRIVLNHWKKIGLKPRSIYSVFRAVMAKKCVIDDLDKRNVFLIARLKQIFPFYEKYFLPRGMDLDKAIFEQQKSRFDSIIAYYTDQKLTLKEMIQKENKRKMPVGMKRNNFLSYLLKRYHNYECQVCHLIKCNNQAHLIQVHHITPLEQGGEDNSTNMIVLCKKHHRETHAGLLTIMPLNKLRIIYKEKMFNLNYN